MPGNECSRRFISPDSELYLRCGFEDHVTSASLRAARTPCSTMWNLLAEAEFFDGPQFPSGSAADMEPHRHATFSPVSMHHRTMGIGFFFGFYPVRRATPPRTNSVN